MRLVDHDRVVAGGDIADLADYEGELLQGGDDDSRLLARQRLGELIGVLVDLHDNTAGVLELVDRVLELAVQDDAVGDDHHLVEYLAVVSACAAWRADGRSRRSCWTCPTRPSAG